MGYRDKYELWLNSEIIDSAMKIELNELEDEKDIEDRFYKDLEFGTGGLRGVMGAGSNRMNIYTVRKATQGLADYINHNYKEKDRAVCIAYDSRNLSEEFARESACTLCANGIKVNLFESLRPTPMLSFAVDFLKSQGGIVITASHNPKEYNGYKVYNEYGGQVTDKAAKDIINFVNKISDFSMVKTMTYNEAVENGLLNTIGEEVDRAYMEKVKALTIRKELVKKSAKDLKIIYTPIHGSGNIPIRRGLKELGYENVHIVPEQEKPNGDFPTAPYPNPEDPKVFKLALDMAKEIQPDIIFGTDPDCDRIGVVARDNSGEYRVLSGNQIGVLLTEYILSSLVELNNLPKNGVVIKTIVTTEMVRKIVDKYNTEIIDVLTGFKYIGEKIREFEESGEKKYLFGFEESYGYLAGDFVKDKDAVIAAILICEMVLYYKNQGKTLYEALNDLYKEYGFYGEELVSIKLEGKEGQEKIHNALDFLRHSMKCSIDGVKIIKKFDYKTSISKNLLSFEEKFIDLPKSNVLKFILEDGSWFVVRPSGTEPKMKIYLSVVGKDIKHMEDKLLKFKNSVMSIIDEACNS